MAALPRAPGCRGLKTSQSTYGFGGMCSSCPQHFWVMPFGGHIFFHWQYLSISSWRCLSRSINFSGNGGTGKTNSSPSYGQLPLKGTLGRPHPRAPASSTLRERSRLELWPLRPQSLIIKCLPHIKDSFTPRSKIMFHCQPLCGAA